MQALVRDFRARDQRFFCDRSPGARRAPAQQAARATVLKLRAQGLSVADIAARPAGTDTPLNRVGVWELLRDEGHGRLTPRPAAANASLSDHPPLVEVLDWPERGVRVETDYAGPLLLMDRLVELDLPGAVAEARMLGTCEIPAICSVLSPLALKAISRRCRRVGGPLRPTPLAVHRVGADLLRPKRRHPQSSQVSSIPFPQRTRFFSLKN